MDQEIHYFDDGRIPFISITYRNVLPDHYGGMNAEGFALENSNSYNLPPGPAHNGFVDQGDDDGKIHTLALATCRTVDDFERLLDSTNVVGRTLTSNYGAIDAYGGAAMFESAGYEYVRYDAIDATDGFIVRSNYSYAGHSLDNRRVDFGPHRHDAAYLLFQEAVRNNELTPLTLFQKIIRDLSTDPIEESYALPYHGYVDNHPYGCIPNYEAVCRESTRGVVVMQGVCSGERPDNGIIWAMCGSPLTTIATPVWVRSGSVPEELDGLNSSRICDRGIQLLDQVYVLQNNLKSVNTWRLRNPSGTGLWDYTFPLETWVYEKTQAFTHSPQFSYDRLEAFQNEMARLIADSLESWHPTYPVTEVSKPVFWESNLILGWGVPEFEGQEEGVVPRGYDIFRSESPFRTGETGERLAIVSDTTFTDTNPLSNGGFYRIVALLD